MADSNSSTPTTEPTVAQAAYYDLLAERDRLRAELDQARASVEQAVADGIKAAKDAASDVLIRYGNQQNPSWCSEWDDILEEAGLPSRRDRLWTGAVYVEVILRRVPVRLTASDNIADVDEAAEAARDHDRLDPAVVDYVRAETYDRTVMECVAEASE